MRQQQQRPTGMELSVSYKNLPANPAVGLLLATLSPSCGALGRLVLAWEKLPTLAAFNHPLKALSQCLATALAGHQGI